VEYCTLELNCDLSVLECLGRVCFCHRYIVIIAIMTYLQFIVDDNFEVVVDLYVGADLDFCILQTINRFLNV
jgi:hypothetical protein